MTARKPSSGSATPLDAPVNDGPPTDPHSLAQTWRRTSRRPGVRRRSWEIHAQVAIDHVRNLAALDAPANLTPDVERQPLRDRIERQLGKAESYLDIRATPLTWLRGTRLEGVWGHIHNAKVALIELLDDDQLVAHSPQVLAIAEKYLKQRNSSQDEPALAAIKVWRDRLTATNGPTKAPPDEDSEQPAARSAAIPRSERHALANALKESYERIANEYHRLRRFQAAIIVVTVVILLLVVGLVVAGARAPQIVPLCFPDPTGTIDQPDQAAAAVCPTGPNGMPTGGDVGTVVLYGLLGAALIGVRLVIRPATPSTVPMGTTRWFQALLKGATGMLTAILGLLFLRAGVVPGFTHVDTQSQILVYAIIFGASQELITRFVDRRSNDLLAAVTSSETTEPRMYGGDR